MIRILTALNSIKPNTPESTTAWRQKWTKVTNGRNTGEYFHTWHNSKEDADTFVGNYFRNLGHKLPKEYFQPVEHANRKPYPENEPKGEFIKGGAITLAS